MRSRPRRRGRRDPTSYLWRFRGRSVGRRSEAGRRAKKPYIIGGQRRKKRRAALLRAEAPSNSSPRAKKANFQFFRTFFAGGRRGGPRGEKLNRPFRISLQHGKKLFFCATYEQGSFSCDEGARKEKRDSRQTNAKGGKGLGRKGKRGPFGTGAGAPNALPSLLSIPYTAVGRRRLRVRNFPDAAILCFLYLGRPFSTFF